MKNFLLILFVAALALTGFTQDAQLITIIDGDTVAVDESGIQVYLRVNNQYIKFHEAEKLVYPSIESDSEVTGVLITVKRDSITFNDTFDESDELDSLFDDELDSLLHDVLDTPYQELFSSKKNAFVSYTTNTSLALEVEKGMGLPPNSLSLDFYSESERVIGTVVTFNYFGSSSGYIK